MPTLIAKPSCARMLADAVRIYSEAQQDSTGQAGPCKIVESKNLAAHFLISEGKRSTAVVLCAVEHMSSGDNRDPRNFLTPILKDIEAMGSTFGAERSICLLTFRVPNPFPIFSRLHHEVCKLDEKKRPKMIEMPHWVSQSEAVAGLLHNLPRQHDIAAECQEYTEAFLRSEHVTQPILRAISSYEENEVGASQDGISDGVEDDTAP